MSFKAFYESTQDLEPIFKKIEKDCKPFLRHQRVLWRGLNAKYKPYGEKKVRTDRIPRGGNQELTDFTNAFLKDNNLPMRNNSMFATPKKDYATVFGDACMVFPKGNFKFVWFPEIIDMNSMKYEQFGSWLKDVDNSILKMKYDDMVHALQKQLIQDEIDNKVSDYWDTMFVQKGMNAFVKALDGYQNKKLPPETSKNELLIECKDYYWIYTSGSPFDPIPDLVKDRLKLK